MDVSIIPHRDNIAIEDFILWAKSSDVGIQQAWKASLQDIVNLLNVSIGSGTVTHPNGQLEANKIVVGSGKSGLQTTDITVEAIQSILKQRLTSVGGGVKFYDGINDGVHSFRSIRGDAEKNILVTQSGSENEIVITLNKECIRNLKLPHNAIPIGNDKGELRFLEKGSEFTLLQTLGGVVQWAPLKVGEVNTIEDLGKGMSLFHSKHGEKLRFKSLKTDSPDIKITEKGGEVSIDYKPAYKIRGTEGEIKVDLNEGVMTISSDATPIKGHKEIDAKVRPTVVPANKAHYTFLVDTNITQDINSWVYTEYEGINDGAIVTFVNSGKKDMKFSFYSFVPHAYISFRWDAERHCFNLI